MSANPLRSAAFLRAYRYLPHHLLNRGFQLLMEARRPSWAVHAAIGLWARRAGIDREECEPGPHASLEDFFLRRLRPGVRPLGPAVVSPVDGILMAQGRADTELLVKGQRLSLDRLVNGRRHNLDTGAYRGGTYVAIFLTPHGYHYIHMPADGHVCGCQWIPGRYFPQNEDALRHIPAIYQRNERAVLRLSLDLVGAAQPAPGITSTDALLVLVGASLVGGIHINDLSPCGAADTCVCDLPRTKGDELAHFRFGSTVVLLFPRGRVTRLLRSPGPVRLGQSLCEVR